MRNKILFIGVGGAGSIMADKAMKAYPKLFDSVAIDCGINRDLSCHQLDLMDRHPYRESAGFTTIKKNVETLISENINEIKNSLGDRFCFNSSLIPKHLSLRLFTTIIPLRL